MNCLLDEETEYTQLYNFYNYTTIFNHRFSSSGNDKLCNL